MSWSVSAENQEIAGKASHVDLWRRNETVSGKAPGPVGCGDRGPRGPGVGTAAIGNHRVRGVTVTAWAGPHPAWAGPWGPGPAGGADPAPLSRLQVHPAARRAAAPAHAPAGAEGPDHVRAHPQQRVLSHQEKQLRE